MTDRLSAIVGLCDLNAPRYEKSKGVRFRRFFITAWLSFQFWQGLVFAQQTPAPPPDEIDILIPSAPPRPPAPRNAPPVKVTSFISSSISELQKAVPELRRLRVSQKQDGLPILLDKVGDKAVDLCRKLPNLISEEDVVKSQSNISLAREKFSYLILAHRGRDSITLEEFRVDLQTGAMLQTNDIQNTESTAAPGSESLWADLGAPVSK